MVMEGAVRDCERSRLEFLVKVVSVVKTYVYVSGVNALDDPWVIPRISVHLTRVHLTRYLVPGVIKCIYPRYVYISPRLSCSLHKNSEV